MRRVLQLIIPVSITLATVSQSRYAGKYSDPQPVPGQYLQQVSGQSPVPGQSWGLRLPDSKILGMVWVGKGSFLMGSPLSEPGRKEDEGPQMTVTLTKGYWMGRKEVT